MRSRIHITLLSMTQPSQPERRPGRRQVVARNRSGFRPPQSVLHVLTKAQITACNNGGNNSVCAAAADFCNTNIFFSLAGTTWDPKYVLASAPDTFPRALEPYLDNPEVASKIGGLASGRWRRSNFTICNNFSTTGDWMRTSRSDLENVINAGVRTVLHEGDADFYLNFLGLEALVRGSPH
jgi:carboxypeptidase C (cathepsin A)